MCNGSKSFALCFKENALKVSYPSFFLDQFPTAEQCKIPVKNSDLETKNVFLSLMTDDIKYYKGKFPAQNSYHITANVNLLLRKLLKCSVGVKCSLFKTYCSNLYWSNLYMVRLYQNSAETTENCI